MAKKTVWLTYEQMQRVGEAEEERWPYSPGGGEASALLKVDYGATLVPDCVPWLQYEFPDEESYTAFLVQFG